jgi:osmotically-inducible protein OsmY
MFLACAATGLALSGCVPVVVTGAATTAGVVAAQERSAGNAVDDAGIKLSINNLYFNQDINDLFRNVNIHVTEGRVMLTGAVNKEETKPKAVELAWRAKGVREVIDEIQISPQSGVGDFGRDTWISGQIRTKILVEKNVRSINYNVEVVNGVVYLLGIAQDKDELDKVAYIASTTKYVKQVVSHVIMKDDPRRRDYLKQQEAGGRPSEERPSDRRYSPGGQSSDDRPSGGQPESQPYRPE